VTDSRLNGLSCTTAVVSGLCLIFAGLILQRRSVQNTAGVVGTLDTYQTLVTDYAIRHLRQVGEEVLGTAAKVEVSKESTTIVGDGSSEVRPNLDHNLTSTLPQP